MATSAFGEAVFEWWCGARKITVYLTEETIDYVAVWGIDMDLEMHDAEFLPCASAPLWAWLTGDGPFPVHAAIKAVGL